MRKFWNTLRDYLLGFMIGVLILVAMMRLASAETLTARDEACLARNIYFEARGEEYDGQLAVAHVTLNRWRQTPTRSVCAVVYQSKQFSWTLRPHRLPTKTDPVYEFALRVARDAVRDPDGDPTFGATHFDGIHRRPWWRRHVQLVRNIGGHSFYWSMP